MFWRTRGVGRITTSLRRRNYGYVHVPKKRKPHLLGHGSEWRKCYVVHPHSQSSRPLEGYQWLTGSVIEDGLPASLLRGECARGELEWLEERLLTAVSDQGGKVSRGNKGRERVRNALSSALTGLWMSGAKHLISSSLTSDPRVEAYWRCNGTNLLSTSQPLFVLHCSQPLDLFSDPTHCHTHTPSSGHPRHLGLFEHSFDQITPFSGCHRYSPSSFTHTVFCCDLRARSQHQLLAHGLMQLFSLTAAECVQNGYPLDQDLVHPLAVQGVITTGSSLTFLAYQLNTLDLRRDEGEGRRNVMWVGPTLDLFSEDGINRQCSELLTQFIMHCPTRPRPILSGFALKTHADSQLVV